MGSPGVDRNTSCLGKLFSPIREDSKLKTGLTITLLVLLVLASSPAVPGGMGIVGNFAPQTFMASITQALTLGGSITLTTVGLSAGTGAFLLAVLLAIKCLRSIGHRSEEGVSTPPREPTPQSEIVDEGEDVTIEVVSENEEENEEGNAPTTGRHIPPAKPIPDAPTRTVVPTGAPRAPSDVDRTPPPAVEDSSDEEEAPTEAPQANIAGGAVPTTTTAAPTAPQTNTGRTTTTAARGGSHPRHRVRQLIADDSSSSSESEADIQFEQIAPPPQWHAPARPGAAAPGPRPAATTSARPTPTKAAPRSTPQKVDLDFSKSEMEMGDLLAVIQDPITSQLSPNEFTSITVKTDQLYYYIFFRDNKRQVHVINSEVQGRYKLQENTKDAADTYKRDILAKTHNAKEVRVDLSPDRFYIS